MHICTSSSFCITSIVFISFSAPLIVLSHSPFVFSSSLFARTLNAAITYGKVFVVNGCMLFPISCIMSSETFFIFFQSIFFLSTHQGQICFHDLFSAVKQKFISHCSLSFLPGISPGCFLFFCSDGSDHCHCHHLFLFLCQFSYFFVVHKSSYLIFFHSVPSSLLSLFVSACLLCSIRWCVLIHLLTCSQDLDARLYDCQGFLVQFLKILHCSFKHVFSFLCHIFHLLSFVSLFNIISVILESLLVAIAEKISDVLIDQALKIITEFLNNFVL